MIPSVERTQSDTQWDTFRNSSSKFNSGGSYSGNGMSGGKAKMKLMSERQKKQNDMTSLLNFPIPLYYNGENDNPASAFTPPADQSLNLFYRAMFVVTEVIKTSAADRAGLQIGMVVLQFHTFQSHHQLSLRETSNLIRDWPDSTVPLRLIVLQSIPYPTSATPPFHSYMIKHDHENYVIEKPKIWIKHTITTGGLSISLTNIDPAQSDLVHQPSNQSNQSNQYGGAVGSSGRAASSHPSLLGLSNTGSSIGSNRDAHRSGLFEVKELLIHPDRWGTGSCVLGAVLHPYPPPVPRHYQFHEPLAVTLALHPALSSPVQNHHDVGGRSHLYNSPPLTSFPRFRSNPNSNTDFDSNCSTGPIHFERPANVIDSTPNFLTGELLQARTQAVSTSSTVYSSPHAPPLFDCSFNHLSFTSQSASTLSVSATPFVPSTERSTMIMMNRNRNQS